MVKSVVPGTWVFIYAAKIHKKYIPDKINKEEKNLTF